MANEDTNSEQSAPDLSQNQDRFIGGHQPTTIIKGHQAVEFGQQPVDITFTRGYSPDTMNLSPSSPPQGGSGVPTAAADSQTPAASSQQSGENE